MPHAGLRYFLCESVCANLTVVTALMRVTCHGVSTDGEAFWVADTMMRRLLPVA